MSKYKYIAFISYQRAEEECAKWFHHQLEHYHIPVDIADHSEELNPKLQPATELRPIFLDEEELASGTLPQAINKALHDSRFLIVLCSPHSAKSEWVNQEVETFINEGRTDYIIPVILDGIPYTEAPDTECFVPALRRLKRTKQERLGINAKAGREIASVKIASELLGVTFDSLWNRYEREKAKERARLIEEKRRLQRLESRYLAEKGLDAANGGNSTLARKIALSALPQNINDLEDRPFVGEVAQMLHQAYKYSNTIYSSASNNISCAEFGMGDNLFAVCGFGIKGIDIWDADKGIPVRHIPSEFTFRHFSISNDGTKIVASDSSRICLFNLKDNTPQDIYVDEECYLHKDIAVISACGRFVAYILDMEDGLYIILYDIEEGKEIMRLTGHTDSIFCINFSPCGRFLISGSKDCTIKIWDITTGECLKTLQAKSWVRSVRYNSDGTKILAALASKVILLWDIGSDEKPRVFRGHTGQVFSARFSSDEQKIISCSKDNTVRLWDLETGESNVIVRHEYMVKSAIMSGDGRYIVSIEHGTMKITDLKGNDHMKPLHRAVDYCVDAPHLSFSTDSKSAYYSSNARHSDDIAFYKWDIYNDISKEYIIKSVKPKLAEESRKHTSMLDGGIKSFYPLDDNRRLLINVDNEGLYLYDVINATVICKWDGAGNEINKIIPGTTANEIVIRTRGGDVSLLDIETMKTTELFNIYELLHATGEIHSDGAGNIYILTYGQVKVYDIAERKIFKSFELPQIDTISRVTFNKDKNLMLITNPRSITLWDTNTGKCIDTLIENERRCHCATFSPDGRYVIIARDNEVLVWDINTSQCVQTITHEGQIFKVWFSPDGTKLAYGTSDKGLYLNNFIPFEQLIEENRAHYASIELSIEERKVLHIE